MHNFMRAGSGKGSKPQINMQLEDHNKLRSK